jgi:tetratricopeptide (TPR) repeat protein
LESAQQEYKEAEVLFETASNYYTQALYLKPDHDLSLIGMGKLQIARGSKSEAIEYFEEALAVNPHSTLALSYLGNIYLELDQPEEAMPYFDQILVYDPGNLLAHLGLSHAYQDLTVLDISQAAASIMTNQFNLQYLVERFR